MSSGGAASNRYLAGFPTEVRDGLVGKCSFLVVCVVLIHSWFTDLYDRCSSIGHPISRPDLDGNGASEVDTTSSVAFVKNGAGGFSPVSYMISVGALGCAIAGLSV